MSVSSSTACELMKMVYIKLATDESLLLVNSGLFH